MKRIVTLLVVGLFAVCFCVIASRDAAAKPEYKTRFDELTKGSKAADAIKEAKCNVCHFGRTKTNRNEFGQAVNKYLTKDLHKQLKAAKDDDNAAKKIDEGLKAALKEKDKAGKTFGSLIDAGVLPAVNPPE